MDDSESVRIHIARGQVIPAHPLALTSARVLDERHQRGLTRYYNAAGAGGIAVGVHTTQFTIREHGLFRPVLELASETSRSAQRSQSPPFALIAGVIGKTEQAVREASLARDLGYHVVLLGLGAMRDADEPALIAHCRTVADVMPLFGFYLQPAVGGRVLSYAFWRAFSEIPNVWAIKIAPFNRYQTLDVIRAVRDSGRDDIALYTGNDDNIVADLLTTFDSRRIVGGLLGQWAVWTHAAVRLLDSCRRELVETKKGPAAPLRQREIPAFALEDRLSVGTRLTDANGAIFDASNNFAGCIPGIHEVLRRQGLLIGTWCLDPHETLSPGQAEEVERICRSYPELSDDAFVQEHLDEWLR